MESTDFRGLMEAYKAVYAPQEVDEATAMAKRGHDETEIRQKIAKSTGGGAAADRATKLADKPTYGDAKKAKQRETLARKQRGDFRNTTSSSPGLHGYAHKSNDPAVKAKQAARGAQRGALTPGEKKQLNREEFDIFDVVLEFLQVEGFAETLGEAEWMMANVIDEQAIDIILGEEQLDEISLKTKMKAYAATQDPEADYAYGSKVHAQGDRLRKAIVKKHGEKAGDDADAHADASHWGRKDASGKKKGYAQSRTQTPNKYRTRADGKMHGQDQNKLKAKLKRRIGIGEEYMDEAQAARENPEKYEREQQKKTAPVRGEKTPMPPRGDKRREDFEKWYAKNVR